MLTRRDLGRFAAAGAAVAPLGAPSLGDSPGVIAIHPLASRNVPGDVAVAVYRPPGYDRNRAVAYPLLLLLHGGNGSERDLGFFQPVFDAEILAGRLPPIVIATPTARRSLYMDYKDGSQRWEAYILDDVLPFLRRSESVATERGLSFIGGWSMGGLGALRIAFKHPDVFAAVAALEPAVEPALAWQGVGPATRFSRPEAVLHPIFGEPVDPRHLALPTPRDAATSHLAPAAPLPAD